LIETAPFDLPRELAMIDELDPYAFARPIGVSCGDMIRQRLMDGRKLATELNQVRRE
jgi:hypothetical protein